MGKIQGFLSVTLSKARDHSTWAVSLLAELTVTLLPSPSFPPSPPCVRPKNLRVYQHQSRATPHHTHNTTHHTTPHGDRETQRQRETERDRERQRETERERETRRDKKREDETMKEKKLEDERGEKRR